MRLSTAVPEGDRDDDRARTLVHAALDAGISLLDTADAYARDDRDVGHNERLIGQVLAERRADGRSLPVVVTKGGLVRPGGAWVPDGRAKHLTAAARASRDRLGVAGLHVYLLHAVDPKTPLATSMRALAKLKAEGIAVGIGLSNVSLHQVRDVESIAPVEAVEIELSPYKVDAIRGGLVADRRARGALVLAHRPLGGAAGVRRLMRDAIVGELAHAARMTPPELALAWLYRQGVVPIPGATQLETALSSARAATLELDPTLARALDQHWLEGTEPTATVSVTHAPRESREVVILMGMPAAGKSTLARDYAARGYLRLNRDDRGGSLADLTRVLDHELAGGARNVVLDNTYGTRASRAHVIETARRHGATVRCVVVETTLEQAQANAVRRILAEHGRLLEPAELVRAKQIGPSAQFRYRRAYEPPAADEGFDAIETVPFTPRPTSGGARALIVELDDLVWVKRPRSADAVTLVPALRDRLRAFAAAGYLIAGTTWETPPLVDARLAELLGIPVRVLRCTHPAGPPVCWCRKPMPGLALALAHAHDIDLARSIHVGRGPADRGFALRAGMRYVDVADGFPEP